MLEHIRCRNTPDLHIAERGSILSLFASSTIFTKLSEVKNMKNTYKMKRNENARKLARMIEMHRATRHEAFPI